MKIVVINRDTQSVKPYITLRPDNAVLRNNDDFYLPNFSNDIICNGGIIVRISRLAKCIAPKFASRCYDGITTGITFIARDVMQNALSETRPTDEAYSFDRSTAIGTEWFTPEQITEKGVLEMSINNNSFDWTIDNLKEVIEQNIAFASEKLTLKMGDLVLITNNTNIDIKVGDNIFVKLNDLQTLNFNIK